MMVAAVLLIVTGRTITRPAPTLPAVGSRGCSSLRVDLDVQWQAIALADRRARHGLCLLHFTHEAALMAGLDRHVVHRRTGRRDRHRLAKQSRITERSAAGFIHFLGDFKVASILESLNVSEGETTAIRIFSLTRPTEYGGFLLMMDTVPEKSGYDYGANYLTCLLHFHSPDRLAQQADLRPQPVDRRLDRRVGDRARDGFRWPGDRHSGGDTAQRRRRRDVDRAGLCRDVAAHCLRVFSSLPGRSLGSVLVGDQLIQCLVHGRQRRSPGLVLLQLGFHDISHRGLAWWACEMECAGNPARGSPRARIG